MSHATRARTRGRKQPASQQGNDPTANRTLVVGVCAVFAQRSFCAEVVDRLFIALKLSKYTENRCGKLSYHTSLNHMGFDQ